MSEAADVSCQEQLDHTKIALELTETQTQTVPEQLTEVKETFQSSIEALSEST